MEYSCLVCGAFADALLCLLMRHSDAAEAPAADSAFLDVPHPTWPQMDIRIILRVASSPADALNAPNALLFGVAPDSVAYAEWAAWAARCESPPCVVLAVPDGTTSHSAAPAAQALRAKAGCAVYFGAGAEADSSAEALRTALARACIGELHDSPCIADSLTTRDPLITRNSLITKDSLITRDSLTSAPTLPNWTWRRHRQTGRLYYIDLRTRRAQYRRPTDYDGAEPTPTPAERDAAEALRRVEMRRSIAERLEAEVSQLRQRHGLLTTQREKCGQEAERLAAQREEVHARERAALRESADEHAALEQKLTEARRDKDELSAFPESEGIPDGLENLESLESLEIAMREVVADTRAAIAQWRDAVERNNKLRAALSLSTAARAATQRRIDAALSQSAAFDAESTALRNAHSEAHNALSAAVAELAPLAERVDAQKRRIAARHARMEASQWREALLAAEIRTHMASRTAEVATGIEMSSIRAEMATQRRRDALRACGTLCARFAVAFMDLCAKREELRSALAEYDTLREKITHIAVARRERVVRRRMECMREWYRGGPRAAEAEAEIEHIDTALDRLARHCDSTDVPNAVSMAKKMISVNGEGRGENGNGSGSGNGNESAKQPLEDCWALLVRRIGDAVAQVQQLDKEKETALRHEALQCAAPELMRHFSAAERRRVAQKLAGNKAITSDEKVLLTALVSETDSRCGALGIGGWRVAEEERVAGRIRKANDRLRDKMMRSYA